MRVITKKVISLPVSDVWRVVSDPEQMPIWNPKCVIVTADGGAPEKRQFEALFRMGSKEGAASGEVVRWQVTQLVVYRYEYHGEPSGLVEERFELEQIEPAVTKLRHEVDFSRSGLPWWVRCLIGYLGRFGKLVGDDPLDGIERSMRKSQQREF